MSFTQLSHTCGRMPLPALSLWPGRQPYRPLLVDGWRGGGPSSVAPRTRNPPTGRRRDSPISSSQFSHGPFSNVITRIRLYVLLILIVLFTGMPCLRCHFIGKRKTCALIVHLTSPIQWLTRESGADFGLCGMCTV